MDDDVARDYILELQAQLKMLNGQIAFKDSKIRRLEGELRMSKAKECKCG